MTLIIFILLLVALILVHEFGHFIVAKLFGIRVDEFSIFFPPRLFSFDWGETKYSLGALPFGGFVKIFGESNEEDASIATNPRSFIHKPRYVQAAVILAGIVFNILIAWLMLSGAYSIGMPTSVDHIGIGTVQDAKVTIVDVLPGSPADKAGIQSNDTVESIQTGTALLDTRTLNTEQGAEVVQNFIGAHQNESMIVTVLRAGKEDHFLAKPVDGITPDHKALGIELDDLGILKLSSPLALVQGIILTKEMTIATATGLAGFFASIVQGTANYSSVAGPVGIATLGSSAVSQGAIATIILISLISINLAIINVLPIPGLDGGRLLFIIIEAITRRPISEKIALRFTIAGFALLVLLMVVITYHDVLKLVHPV